jgi:hypothetical protein
MMANGGMAVLALCMVLAGLGPARADEIAFPPSCFAMIHAADQAGPPADGLSVIIDETVGFDANMINRVNHLVQEWLAPGRSIDIYQFSASLKDRYLEKVLSGRVDPAASDDFLDDLKRSDREKFESCAQYQQLAARAAVRNTMLSILANSDKTITNSDIIVSLARISHDVAASAPPHRIVLVVSDMLENSGITSFYSHNKVRAIDPAAELAKVAKAQMFGDFGGAKVSIFGLGYFAADPGASGEVYLDPQHTQAIVNFWSGYIRQSNGTVGEIGTPLMIETLQ